ncbi:Ras-associated and pleckstrin y domains-containing protein 1 [Mactra antiquata]
MELEDDYRSGQDIEPDSDVDDPDCESQLSQWLGELENYAKDLEAGETGTVRRRQKTVVTPKMAMESFRYSFMSDNQDVNFDAILGELCELETQLGNAQSEMNYYGNQSSSNIHKHQTHVSGGDIAQRELDALASEISRNLEFRHDHKRPMGELEYFRTHYPGDLGGYSDAMLDIAETDSAFSESASLPSSESFTSMVTVSSSAEAAGMGDAGSTGSCSTLTPQSLQCDEELKARLKAEKIRIALEKIKEAKIKKLFVRAFASDGSSKSIMVDEKMTILEVISILADKNHLRLNTDLAVVEHMPELYMERILEDHDSLVENMVMWTRDTKNKILFESRPQKNDLFRCPERYLLVSSSSEKGASLDPKRRENLIQEFFSGPVCQVPEVEGVLYLKSDGKKAWKKYYFVLRASGLYYNPKGKISKSTKDLVCLVQFEFVELYLGIHWKKKYHSPTDFCFALKHPQIQKKTSKFIRYLCAENKAALDQWIMGIRIAKFGKQLLTNYRNLEGEILTWDSRDLRTSISDQQNAAEALAELNQQGDLSDSRMSMPEPGSRHSIVNVKTSMLVKHTHEEIGINSDVVCLEIDKVERQTERKSSLTGAQISEPIRIEKVPVKRVSFSNTHSVINDTGEEVLPVRHRDSITSASTDSSEDSTSSGEGRFGAMSHRSSKLRAKLPVTTGTTKHLSEMVQTSIDGSSVGSMDSSTEDWRPNVSSPVQKEMAERRKSAPIYGDVYPDRKSVDGQVKDHRSLSHTIHYDQLPLSPSSNDANSQFSYRGSKGIMSPPPNKGTRTHSRGSSISSVSSSDSYQGYVMSPTNSAGSLELYSEQSQGSWSRPEDPSQLRSQGQSPKPGPPTAQKPAGIKKGRPQSGPSPVPGEKGHRRNTSKSSLESVEEIREAEGQGHMTPIPVSSPIPPRAVCPPPGVTQGHTRTMSQPCTPSVMQAAAKSQNQHPRVDITQQTQQTKGPHSAPATPQPSSTPVGSIGCLSPRLSGHRSSVPKAVAPPVVPMVPSNIPDKSQQFSPNIQHDFQAPPPLVPPTPRNPNSTVNTHKKRPSGGNIVVNGNQPMSGSPGAQYPDIAANKRSNQCMTSESQGQGQNEDSYAPLPFMAELNQHMHHMSPPPNMEGTHHSNHGNDQRIPPQVLPKPNDQRLNGNASASQPDNVFDYSHQNVYTDNVRHQQISNMPPKKQGPPPPPKRSENTKLSSSMTSQTYNIDNSSSTSSCSVPNETGYIDPIYDNCEGILDVNDLPPPPPELLENFEGEGQFQGHSQEGQRSVKLKAPPPPPPPKRNRETQLSSS